MRQTGLWNKQTDTSREAAASIQHDLGRLQAMVMRYVRQCGERGCTCDEAEVALNLTHQTCSARFHDLHHKDVIVDHGIRRKTRSGRKAIVWFVVS